MKIDAAKIRLAILVVFGVLVVVLARPTMQQIMLMQESRNAKVNMAPPEKTVSIDPAQALGTMGPGKSESGSKDPEVVAEGVASRE